MGWGVKAVACCHVNPGPASVSTFRGASAGGWGEKLYRDVSEEVPWLWPLKSRGLTIRGCYLVPTISLWLSWTAQLSGVWLVNQSPVWEGLGQWAHRISKETGKFQQSNCVPTPLCLCCPEFNIFLWLAGRNWGLEIQRPMSSYPLVLSPQERKHSPPQGSQVYLCWFLPHLPQDLCAVQAGKELPSLYPASSSSSLKVT